MNTTTSAASTSTTKSARKLNFLPGAAKALDSGTTANDRLEIVFFTVFLPPCIPPAGETFSSLLADDNHWRCQNKKKRNEITTCD